MMNGNPEDMRHMLDEIGALLGQNPGAEDNEVVVLRIDPHSVLNTEPVSLEDLLGIEDEDDECEDEPCFDKHGPHHEEQVEGLPFNEGCEDPDSVEEMSPEEDDEGNRDYSDPDGSSAAARNGFTG